MRKQMAVVAMMAAVLMGSGSSGEESLTFATIANWVKDGEVKDVEGIIARLPDAFTRRASLVFESRSTQQTANYLNPRLITYDTKTGLVLSFGGDPLQIGGKSIEFIEPDPVTKAFNFRLIDFALANPVVESPTTCIACHHGRPIWDTYTRWPGFYGSGHGEISRVELRHFKQFRQAAQNNPRYSRFFSAAAPMDLLPDTNMYLGIMLNMRNFERIDHLLSQHKDWAKLKPIMLDAFDIPDINTSRFKEVVIDLAHSGYNISRAEIEAHMEEIKDAQIQYFRNKELRMSRIDPKIREGDHIGDIDHRLEIAIFRALMVKLGITQVDDWTMTFRERSLDFTSGASGFNDFRHVLRKSCAEILP